MYSEERGLFKCSIRQYRSFCESTCEVLASKSAFQNGFQRIKLVNMEAKRRVSIQLIFKNFILTVGNSHRFVLNFTDKTIKIALRLLNENILHLCFTQGILFRVSFLHKKHLIQDLEFAYWI